MPAEVYYRDSSEFQPVNAPNLFYHDGTQFQQVTKGYYHDGTEFRETYIGSDPIKYTFLANRSKYFRHTDGYWGSSPSVVSLRTGAWNVDSGGGTYSNSTYVGVFGFSSINNGSLTLAQALAERPYVTTATPTDGGSAENYIEVTRGSQTFIGFGSAYGTWYMGKYTGDTTDTYPDADNANQTGKISKTLASGSPIQANDPLKFTPSVAEMQVLADHMDTNPLWITNKNSIANIKAAGGFTNTEYVVFYGTGETTPPKLVLTLDYVAP
tara:strand:+ start:187 stop:990 length:804 start_codon:yes stop_codon:yes gene_type:complete